MSTDDAVYDPHSAAVKRRSLQALDKLTLEQRRALARWRAARGRTWRSQLFAAWEKAGAGVPDYAPELQQIRNKGGASIITAIRTHDLYLEYMALPKAKPAKPALRRSK